MSLSGTSISGTLQPKLQYFYNIGLSNAQVAKAIASSPPILGLSIEENLKPTVQWLLDLGISNAQVAKAIASSPPILGCSIEENLKPDRSVALGFGAQQRPSCEGNCIVSSNFLAAALRRT